MAQSFSVRNILGIERPAFRSWESHVAFVLLALAVISGAATYAALTETPPLGNDPATVIWLLNLDIILLALLFILVARRIVALWSGRRRKLAGSRLHIRLVYAFSLLAAVPVIVMTVTSAFFFHFGVQTWFSERIATAVDESLAVAQAYFEEHREVIRADTLAMANDLNRQSSFFLANEEALEKIVRTQALLRNFSEAIVFDSRHRVLARSGLTFTLEFEPVPDYAIRRANEGDVVVMTGAQEDRIRALVKLENFSDTYLFVGRMVDPKVLGHLASTREASKDYDSLKTRYSGLQIAVTMIFVMIGLLLLLAATWYGLTLARQLVSPIGLLIDAAERVRAGDLMTRVPEEGAMEEFDYLAGAFNRMTRQIEAQRNDLVEANRQIDRRRHLTESVLRGVSSGVIGVNAQGVINLANASAAELTGQDAGALTGRHLEAAIPEAQTLFRKAQDRPGRVTRAEIPHVQDNGARRIFLMSIVAEPAGDEDLGAIVTFDDITELQSAQRKAAWADVARRIAHEIKNPLTPIQLSAERLKKKYMPQAEEGETFARYTDTIIRHVEDIGRMVNEFSDFARMPEPVIKPGNLTADVTESSFLLRQAYPQISFSVRAAPGLPPVMDYDAQMIRQAVTNLLQNAVDSILMKTAELPSNAETIAIFLGSRGADGCFIAVSDSGQGLPPGEAPERLAEPYVTHKTKGTGLGLAIVKKIMEDHGGALIVGVPDWLRTQDGWRDQEGATVVLVLPESESAKEVT